MKRKIGVLLGGAAMIVVLSATGASAAPSPNACVGQDTAYAVRGNDISPFLSARGMGHVARVNGVSVKDATGFIKALCGR